MEWTEKQEYTLEDLHEICVILRDPAHGCPWDKVQTHQSIRKNFLEETCEVLEAIDADAPDMLREELGDVLMQVVLHTCMEEEKGRFTLSDVCGEVCRKLVYRHPHIFSSSGAETAGLNSWDALKNKEKGRRGLADEVNTVPATLPALMRAQKLQKRAASYRPQLAETALARQQLDQAYAVLKARLDQPQPQREAGAPEAPPAAEQEAGAFLLAAANVLRLAGVDAEQALSLAARQFAGALTEQQ